MSPSTGPCSLGPSPQSLGLRTKGKGLGRPLVGLRRSFARRLQILHSPNKYVLERQKWYRRDCWQFDTLCDYQMGHSWIREGCFYNPLR